MKSCCVLQDHHDDERDKTVFHNTTPDLQDPRLRPIFWSRTGLVLRPRASDHITDGYNYDSVSISLRFDSTAVRLPLDCVTISDNYDENSSVRFSKSRHRKVVWWGEGTTSNNNRIYIAPYGRNFTGVSYDRKALYKFDYYAPPHGAEALSDAFV